MKVKTSVSRLIFKENVLNDDIREFMEKKHICNFWCYKAEVLDIDELELIDSYPTTSSCSIDCPGYWYANELYDKVHELTNFMCGDREDMDVEIIEPGYPCDIPYADKPFETVEEFHRWMIEKGKDSV